MINWEFLNKYGVLPPENKWASRLPYHQVLIRTNEPRLYDTPALYYGVTRYNMTTIGYDSWYTP